MYRIYALRDARRRRSAGCPRWLRGVRSAASGSPSPTTARDPGGMETRARRDGGHWVLNGTKRWITNGTIADVAIVWAKDDEGVIRGFLVERGTPGFSTHDIKGKFSLRASITSELVLEDVRVPASSQLPGAQGLAGPFSCLNQARYGIVWGAIGAARTCYLTALRYAQTRTQFGRPLAGYQLVQAEARAHGDRDHQGAAPRAAARPAEGRRQGAARAGVAREAQQRRPRARDRPPRPRHARRQRHRRTSIP